MTKQEAYDLLRSTPGATAMLDNDCWYVNKPKPDDYDQMSEAAQDEWWEQAELFSSRDVEGCDYGGGLVEVLVLAFDGLTCEGV